MRSDSSACCAQESETGIKEFKQAGGGGGGGGVVLVAFPRVRGFWEDGRQFIPRLCFFFFF